jgi:hypothetical protein
MRQSVDGRLWNQVPAHCVGIAHKGTLKPFRCITPERTSSCRVEPLSHFLHPLSLALRVLLLFQLTPLHTEEALALVALAFTTVVFIAVASTVVQPYAAEWR